MMEMARDKIIDVIYSISGHRSARRIFSDWVEIMAIQTINATKTHTKEIIERRKNRCVEILSEYTDEEFSKLMEATEVLVQELEENVCDILGSIYNRIGANNEDLQQFFTPSHISGLMSDLVMNYNTDYPVHLIEPCCGSGSIVIGTIKSIKDHGIDYRLNVMVTAQDIDPICAYMIYVQLSLMGIKARIMRSDFAIKEDIPDEQIFFKPDHIPAEDIYYTPQYVAYAAELAMKAQKEQ